MPRQQNVLERALSNAAVTREVRIEPGALAALPAIVTRHLPCRRILVVADQQTLKAAGAAVCDRLWQAGIAFSDPMVLHGEPRVKPQVEVARDIAGVLASEPALIPVAVGSGVVNDLAKYAASLLQRPYVCVATAASMDGYAAAGAALLDNGFKQTFDCPPPVAVVADLDILAAAPTRMASWGYGDIAGKIVAGADWRLADALEIEPINPVPFHLVQDNVRAWLADPGAIASRHPESIRALMTGLTVAGFAMQAHTNSRPASGCEHLISHLWEMEQLIVAGEPAAHGACVGVGTIAMLALYEWLLAQDLTAAQIEQARQREPDSQALEAEIAAAFTIPHLAASARREMAAKTPNPARRHQRMAVLARVWPDLRTAIAETLLPARQMQAMLAQCGAAHHPGDLGVPLAKLAADCRRARLIRRRYTLLDLLDDLGWLDRAIADVFATSDLWSRNPEAAINRQT